MPGMRGAREGGRVNQVGGELAEALLVHESWPTGSERHTVCNVATTRTQRG